MPSPCIGVFDSGFGGLTVLKALLELIPGSDYLYFGDTARLPYGSKSAETVAKYAIEAAHFLERKGAQMLVVACNTATALAFDQIEAATRIPVVGVVEPGAQAAAAASENESVVVIATEATVNSHAYQKALEAHGMDVREMACPLLVPLVEEGWGENPVTEQIARIYLDQAFTGGFQAADTLLLGCTHYPLLASVLRRIVPANVTIVDSAEATARVVSKLMATHPYFAAGHPTHPSRIKFFATDSTEKFKRLGEHFLGQPIEQVEHVDLKE
jgi:glutamate racemase